MSLIEWLPWEKRSFDRALRENKPILLSISATWCHWCHEMDRQAYADAAVAGFLSGNFVAIRVDADQRPDIDRRYNQGGWPSTVFLTPVGEVITGATFLGSEEFLELARRVLGIHRELVIRAEIGDFQEKKWKLPRQRVEFAAKEGLFEADRQDFLLRFDGEVKARFDPVYGGFGDGPKFPQADVLGYCLDRFQTTRDPQLSLILRKTLEAYAEGGLFDPIEGGFFRYSTDRRFERPHFEKLLGDNLRLASIYFRAGRLFGEGRFLSVSEKTFSFLDEWLGDGQFYRSSVNADESYYTFLSRAERKKATRPKVDETIFTDGNGLAADVLFELGKVESARDLLRNLWEDFRDERGFFIHHREEAATSSRFLTDQVYVLCAWRKVFSEERAGAGDLLRQIIVNFYDEAEGGFFDRVREEEEIGLLREKLKPLEENLLLLPILADFGFAERAEKTLIEIFNLYREPVLQHAPLASYLNEFF